MSKYLELLEQRDALNREIESVRAIEAADAVVEIKRLIGVYGLLPEDLGWVAVEKIAGKATKRSEKTFAVKEPARAIPPKYRNPETGATWSGRGIAPKWMTGERDQWLIDNAPRRTQNNLKAVG